ncbi:hypothetical protein PF011_g15689 [Phytophthora fragariae]|uniref:Pentacotripeptide-repeat region of PRORP domain-containing protein n=1 Tax=Phytophthora fragariae TaxID=53985 RepID=A0A6A3JQ35_9STRA|nr:hypothetical protein PF011_g15689 [Phytophthora fragariae]
MTGPPLLRSLVSALRRPARHLVLHRSPALQLSSAAAVAAAPKSSDALTLLERSIAQRRPAQALDLLAQLQAPAAPQLLQRLALLLARERKSRGHALRAFKLLRGVYRAPGLKPDDYTQLASIYVLDACLRFRLLDQAMELYDEAVNQAVGLDLPAYDGLLTALLDAKRVEEATEILKEVLGGDDVCPVELTFLPVLLELVKGREYDDATQLMRQGHTRGVEFTSETFHPLLVLAEKDTTSTDSLIKFLQFVEDSWEEYKAIDDFDPEENDLDDPENPFRSLVRLLRNIWLNEQESVRSCLSTITVGVYCRIREDTLGPEPSREDELAFDPGISRPILGTARLPGFLTSGLRLSDLLSRHPTRACSFEIAPSYNASICWICTDTQVRP